MAVYKKSLLLNVLVLLCFFAAVYSQNMTCGDVDCSSVGPDDLGNERNECCSMYFSFLNGCCSSEENSNLRLIRDIVIGVSVGVGGLILILICICICCCVCVCAG
ncbi:PREDICTED: uncharacterized protein LOC100632417 [Amphimedon queenslandica]|uniref:Uncharacterized protein n=2 Tax=Amphimedon queenslandica TaxID=400682 RepID=A0AAN0IFP8_AMPQE|nr:PREDICTED: uncharacterized protein LOC100632417 [Amphimedon queenslandica]|eukprot:XP_003387631.1 PREDICTED: uncharacterized protein LOC100632417 [Amphimedon queenslandica]